ncbi:SIR2 family protein [Rhizobium leguminosarum]|uniref:SIR2 family protein n=1 Tax=Rhizobium leguminosarum TaxID=384 RepID=UPI001C9729D1|nr:SIR2 family protein [Rhizobium leguminosarum]MBY5738156.1 Sir2 family NAD-dependent protein deacetylase [Rhizobium leguminosarum]
MEHVSEVADLAKSKRLILFIGSGVSASLGLPDWNGLIRMMSDHLNYDHALYTMLGRYESLAEYYFLNGGSKAELAAWMKTNWHAATIKIESSEIHRHIASLDVPIIYTTNYEHWLEKALKLYGKRYRRVIKGSDLSKVDPSETEVVKFHGDVTQPKTMVITEADYFERLKFESELDIKLRSDMQKYSILFLGYSLSDINLRNMIYRLSVFRKHYVKSHQENRSFILTNKLNEVQEKIFHGWGITTIYGNHIDNKRSLLEFLSELAFKVSSSSPSTA